MIRGVVFAEAPEDYRTLRSLVRVLLRTVGAAWLRDMVEEQPTDVIAAQIELSFEPLTSIGKSLVSAGARPLTGHFDGRPGADGAAQARNAWHLLRRRNVTLAEAARYDFAFFLRDADGKRDERQLGLDQAEAVCRGPTPCARPKLLMGLAITEREGWVIASFEPRDERERQALERERARTTLALEADLDRLINGNSTDDRDNKRVLAALIGDDVSDHIERIEQCELSVLLRRGASTGLTAALRGFAYWLLECHGALVDGSCVRAAFGMDPVTR